MTKLMQSKLILACASAAMALMAGCMSAAPAGGGSGALTTMPADVSFARSKARGVTRASGQHGPALLLPSEATRAKAMLC
jgi:hypothetical protein